MKVPPARIVFQEEDRAEVARLVDAALRSGALTLGPVTRTFEDEFAARHGGAHAIATSSGTSALEIIFRAIGVEGREVVVPTNTFAATAFAVLHAGGRIRFADVSAATLAVTADTLAAAVTPDTTGVVLVHIGGYLSPDVDAIAEWCASRGLWLVEDAAHAHGSSYGGRAAGSWGRAAAFSFYPTKVITSGEGGMIVTADERVRDEAVIYRDQGKAGFLGGDHVRLGSAWRMSEVHAAIGLVHHRRLDQFIARRNEVAAAYDRALAPVPGIRSLAIAAGSVSNYYKYVALLDSGIDRAQFKARLRDEHGVSASGEVYASPLHEQPVFAELAHGPLPVAEDVCRRHVCLPLHSDMTDDEAAYVTHAVQEVLGG